MERDMRTSGVGEDGREASGRVIWGDAEKGLACAERVMLTSPAAERVLAEKEGVDGLRTSEGHQISQPCTQPVLQDEEAVMTSRPAPSSQSRSRIWVLLTSKTGAGQPVDTSDPPDGGVRAWTIVVLCHFLGFHTWGFLNAFGVLQSYYVVALNQTPSNVSWIGSLQAFFLFITSSLAGRLTDAGYYRQLLALGCTLQVIGFLLVSFAKRYWQILLCHGLGIGLGGSLFFIPSMSVVTTYFRRRRPLALALVVLGNSAGGLFYVALLQNVLPTLGYAWAMRIIAAFMFVTFVAANILLKERLIERKPGPLVDWKAFVEPAYGTFTAGMFCSNVGMWIPVFYLGAYGRDVIGISTHDAANLLLIINGVGLFGRIIPTTLTQVCGPMNLLVPLTFISSVVLFSWVSVKDKTGTIIFDVFFGIFMAAAQGMLPPSLASLTHDLSKMGVRLGMVFSTLGFALLMGNPFAGWLISLRHGSYLYAQVFAAASMLVGAILLGVARYVITGKKAFVKV